MRRLLITGGVSWKQDHSLSRPKLIFFVHLTYMIIPSESFIYSNSQISNFFNIWNFIMIDNYSFGRELRSIWFREITIDCDLDEFIEIPFWRDHLTTWLASLFRLSTQSAASEIAQVALRVNIYRKIVNK